MSDLQLSLYTVEIKTSRWPEMVAWYRDVLGMRSLFRVVDEEYSLLEAGGSMLAILQADEVGEPSARFSLSFEVESIDPICLRLQEAGADCEIADRHPEGLSHVKTTDPDGNRVRVFAWPKRSEK